MFATNAFVGEDEGTSCEGRWKKSRKESCVVKNVWLDIARSKFDNTGRKRDNTVLQQQEPIGLFEIQIEFNSLRPNS